MNRYKEAEIPQNLGWVNFQLPFRFNGQN